MKKTICIWTLIGLLALSASLAWAGGRIETIDISDGIPTPFPGTVVAKIKGIEWDIRTIPVNYSINTQFDPVPNPLGPPVLTLDQAREAIARGMQSWNDIPTSFIEMRLEGEVNKATPAGFDMIFEQTFITPPFFAAIASSASTSLITDVVFNDGDDIDGDGDSDVSSAIATAQDVDNDGDVEFPAGLYEAGTILDNDVQYNASLLRFTVDPADADTNSLSTDLEGVAAHELGHSHGLSHVLDNNTSKQDGTATTMFPFIDTGDPATELSIRTLNDDDIAWSSFLYPEGSASSGIAALQPGDLAFDSRYGIISGEAFQGAQGGIPLAGASVAAYKANGGKFVGSAYSGVTQLGFIPASGTLFVIDEEFNIPEGCFEIPIEPGRYDLRIEAVDGSPVSFASTNQTVLIGTFFNQGDFSEEYYNGAAEAAIEDDPGDSQAVVVNPGRESGGNDIVTNVVSPILEYGTLDFTGFINVPEGFLYAVAFPAPLIAAVDPGADGFALQAGLFETFVLDDSVPAQFAQTALCRCTINNDGTANIDLQHPLRREKNFLVQDSDFSTYFFDDPVDLGNQVASEIASGELENLCLVLEVGEEPFEGVSAQPPLIGLDFPADVPLTGRSFFSQDGGATWNPSQFNFRFSLQATDK
ncbi:MAG TPA: hypothetical protein VLV83_23295 [Acidobacteriota bacterium]|nr:hypothetical protein [Acidobacteriota bacterium]